MFITRLVFTIALSLTGLAALAGFSPLHLIADAMAQSASDIAKRIAAGDGTRSRQRLGNDHRERIDDLLTLRGIQRKCVSEDQVGIY